MIGSGRLPSHNWVTKRWPTAADQVGSLWRRRDWLKRSVMLLSLMKVTARPWQLTWTGLASEAGKKAGNKPHPFAGMIRIRFEGSPRCSLQRFLSPLLGSPWWPTDIPQRARGVTPPIPPTNGHWVPASGDPIPIFDAPSFRGHPGATRICLTKHYRNNCWHSRCSRAI